MVKNEAIFTYLAPMNLIAWILHPLRWFLPFRKFVRLNRTLIKITHLPLLAPIYLYERTMLRSSVYVPTDAITNHNPSSQSTLMAFKTPHEALNPVGRSLRRKTSIASQQQEHILEQVFARPYKRGGAGTIRSDMSEVGKGSVVNSWVNNVLSASPPTDEGFTRSHRRPFRRGRSVHNRFGGIRDHYSSMAVRTPARDFSVTRSTRSNPEEFVEVGVSKELTSENDLGADADNEANSVVGEETTEESAHDAVDGPERRRSPRIVPSKLRDFSGPGPGSPSASSATSRAVRDPSSPRPETTATSSHPSRRRNHHDRTPSSNTVLFNPVRRPVVSDGDDDDDDDNNSNSNSNNNNNNNNLRLPGRMSPGGGSSGKSRSQTTTRPRPIANNPRLHFQPTPNLPDRGQSARTMMRNGEIPSSFATQMAMATGGGDVLFNRLVLAKIGALEESMKDIKEILGEVRKAKKKDDRERGGGGGGGT